MRAATADMLVGYNCNDHREDEPTGYLDWPTWANKMHKTHLQHRCPECGLFKIWIHRETVAKMYAALADLSREEG